MWNSSIAIIGNMGLSNLSGHIRRYAARPAALVSDLWRFGALGSIQWAFSNLGVPTYSKTKYPIVDLTVTTRFDGTWKRIEKGEMELECIRQLSDSVAKGATVFDIGAWHGTYALLLSHLVGSDGRVVCFEPMPDAAAILADNVRRNRASNVRIERSCASDSTGETKFRIDGAGGTESSMVRKDLGTPGAEITVPCVSLDDFCEQNGIWPSGIKLDVEGAEGLVIAGAKKLIARKHPWILMEFHGQFFNEDERKAVWDKITSGAKAVSFIEGRSKEYSFGSKMTGLPDCDYFHAFVQF